MKLKIVTLIAALVGLIFMSIPTVSIVKSVSLKKHGIMTNGTVLDVTSQRKGLPRVSVTFDTREGSEITTDAIKRQYVTEGDVVPVWYDPANPQKIDFGDTVGYNMRGVFLGGLLFVFGFYYFIRYSVEDSSGRKLVKEGVKIAAEFVSVERNEKYQMDNKNPWVIKCKWTDNRIDKTYFFLSKDYIIDPVPYLEGRTHLDVYIDPLDPSRYFLDTSFMPKGNITIG